MKSDLVMSITMMSFMHDPWREQEGCGSNKLWKGKSVKTLKVFDQLLWKWLSSPWLLALYLRCGMILLIKACWNWQHLLIEDELLKAGEDHADFTKELLLYLRKKNILSTMRVLIPSYLHLISSARTYSQALFCYCVLKLQEQTLIFGLWQLSVS